jgi:hypothetical protein
MRIADRAIPDDLTHVVLNLETLGLQQSLLDVLGYQAVKLFHRNGPTLAARLTLPGLWRLFLSSATARFRRRSITLHSTPFLNPTPKRRKAIQPRPTGRSRSSQALSVFKISFSR